MDVLNITLLVMLAVRMIFVSFLFPIYVTHTCQVGCVTKKIHFVRNGNRVGRKKLKEGKKVIFSKCM